MDKVAKISDYEKENLAEINEFEVSIEDLKKYGLSDEILAYEGGLRKFYGDEILIKTEIDDRYLENSVFRGYDLKLTFFIRLVEAYFI